MDGVGVSTTPRGGSAKARFLDLLKFSPPLLSVCHIALEVWIVSSLSLSTLAPWVTLSSQESAELLGYFSFDGKPQNPSRYIQCEGSIAPVR